MIEDGECGLAPRPLLVLLHLHRLRILGGGEARHEQRVVHVRWGQTANEIRWRIFPRGANDPNPAPAPFERPPIPTILLSDISEKAERKPKRNATPPQSLRLSELTEVYLLVHRQERVRVLVHPPRLRQRPPQEAAVPRHPVHQRAERDRQRHRALERVRGVRLRQQGDGGGDVPSRGALHLHLQAARGRVGRGVLDEAAERGGGQAGYRGVLLAGGGGGRGCRRRRGRHGGGGGIVVI